MRIHGMVESEVTLTMDDLLDLPLDEHHITLTCVSNPVGGDLVGNATWLGFPVRELLQRAKPQEDADMVLSHSIDGFTASTPIEALSDDRNALLAVGMNGSPLPPEHGFPARLVVPGLYGFVSATKWVTELEVTRFDEKTAYWTDRGWDAKAPILVASRIEVPKPLGKAPAGDITVAGTAWAQRSGVKRVDVKLDDGGWTSADLAEAVHRTPGANGEQISAMSAPVRTPSPSGRSIRTGTYRPRSAGKPSPILRPGTTTSSSASNSPQEPPRRGIFQLSSRSTHPRPRPLRIPSTQRAMETTPRLCADKHHC